MCCVAASIRIRMPTIYRCPHQVLTSTGVLVLIYLYLPTCIKISIFFVYYLDQYWKLDKYQTLVTKKGDRNIILDTGDWMIIPDEGQQGFLEIIKGHGHIQVLGLPKNHTSSGTSVEVQEKESFECRIINVIMYNNAQALQGTVWPEPILKKVSGW